MDKKDNIKIKGKIFRAYLSAEIVIKFEMGREKLTNFIAYLCHKFLDIKKDIDYNEHLKSYQIHAYPAEIELREKENCFHLNAVRWMTDDVVWAAVFSIVGYVILALGAMFTLFLVDAKYGRDTFENFLAEHHWVHLIYVLLLVFLGLIFVTKYFYSRWKGVRDLKNSITDLIYTTKMISKRNIMDDPEAIRVMIQERIHSRGLYENPVVMVQWHSDPVRNSSADKKLLAAMETVFGKEGKLFNIGNMMVWKSKDKSYHMKVFAIPSGLSTEMAFTNIIEFDSAVKCAFGLPTIWTLFIAFFKFLPLVLSGYGSYSVPAGMLDYGLFPGWIIGVLISPFLGPIIDRIQFKRKSRFILIKAKELADILEQHSANSA